MKKLLITLFLLNITIAIQAQNISLFQSYDNKKGAVNNYNEIIIPAIYDDIVITDDLAIVKLKNRYGCIDQNGKQIIPVNYQSIDIFSSQYLRVKLSGKSGLIDHTGKEVVSLKYDAIANLCDGISRVYLNNKYGYIDSSGREITPQIYIEADLCFTNGYARVSISNPEQRQGIIDKTGKEIVPIKYYEAHHFSDGLAMVRFGEKWGFVDSSGKEIIPLKYDHATDFSEDLAGFNIGALKNEYNYFEGGKWGFIDKNGNEVIPAKYESVQKFSEGLVAVKLKDKWGFIDTNGKKVISHIYINAFSFSEGLAAVSSDSYNYGFINKSGEMIIGMSYEPVIDNSDSWYGFKNGRALVKYISSYGFVLKNGQNILYNSKPYFNEKGIAKVTDKGKYGLIDASYKEIIPLKYDDLGEFINGFALVKINDKYGYVDKTGKEVIPCIYSYAFNFNEDLAVVSSNGKYGVIDTTGKQVVPFKYSYYTFFNGKFKQGKLIVGTEDNKLGAIDKTGKEIIPQKYDELNIYPGNIVSMKLNGKWGFLDKNGNEHFYDYTKDFTFFRIVSINGKWGLTTLFGNEIHPLIYQNIKNYDDDIYFESNKGWHQMTRYTYDLDSTVYHLIDNGKFGGVLISKHKTISYSPGLGIGFEKKISDPVVFPSEDEIYYEIHANGVIFYKSKKTGYIGAKHTDGTILIHPYFKNVYPAYLASDYSQFIKSNPKDWEFTFTTLTGENVIGKIDPVTREISGITMCNACFGGSNFKEVTHVIKGQTITYNTTRVQTLRSEKFDVKTGTTIKTYDYTSKEITKTTPDKVVTTTEKEECTQCSGKGSFPVILKWDGTKYIKLK